MKPACKLTAIVLAGGRSSRLGVDKALEKLDGQTVIEKVLSRLSTLADETLIVISQRQAGTPYLSNVDAPRLVDLYANRGALGGVYTGLKASACDHALAVACDMPFLNAGLIRYMASLAPDFDAVVPRFDGYLEPLHSVYSKSCLPAMESVLVSGRLRIVDIFDKLKVRYVESEELDRFDSERLSFFNINTPADLDLARKIASREKAAH